MQLLSVIFNFVVVIKINHLSSFYLSATGAYAAFSAGGGVHFKLERTSCQQSLKYISPYNTEGAYFSTESAVYVRYIILY